MKMASVVLKCFQTIFSVLNKPRIKFQGLPTMTDNDNAGSGNLF